MTVTPASTVSVITGCSTGIGYATALRLARDGHHVVATMRNPATCDLADVAEAEGLALEVRALDVDDDASVDALFGDLLAGGGAVDVLVNNAGLGNDGDVTEQTPFDVFRRVMETNYFGALRCTKAVLPSMRARGRGCIVNVTSQAGRIVAPGMAPYAASKFALEAASEALALEVMPFGVRVALIEPGAIMTAIWGKIDMTPPTGAYAPVRNRLAKFVMSELSDASSADEVAACVAEAVSTEQPRLRWPVGKGAERNIRLRSGWTDEEYFAVWAQPDDDAFVAQMTAD